MKNKKLGVLLGLSVLSAGLVVSTISFGKGGLLGINTRADATYEVVFSKDNGAISASALKTTFAAAKTKLNNDIQVAFKNCEAVSGKVGKIKAGGFYANSLPICGMSAVVVTSDAEAGDATIKWGRTSACADGEADLKSSYSIANANYFRIVANNDVVIEKVEIVLSCDGSDNGGEALDSGNNPISNPFTPTLNSGAYDLTLNAPKSSYAKISIPDFIINGNDAVPVRELSKKGSDGFFDGCNTTLKEVYLPQFQNLVFGSYTFYTATAIKEFTMPYGLSSIQGNSIPKGALEVLNINCKNVDHNSHTVIDSSNFSNLKTINVSYDVEFLPSIISSWPSGVTVNYEGTEAEWAALTSVTGTSSYWTSAAIDVMCSDTTVSTVNLHFENAKLGDDEDSKSFTFINGKEFADPGKPVYDENALKFDGWYTQAEGGEKVTFPLTITEDRDLYAHFVDWPAGSSIDNAKPITAGDSLTWTCDEDNGWYYFSVTAETDSVFMFVVSNVEKTGGAGYSSPYVKFYNSSKALQSVDYSADPVHDVKKVAKYASGAEEWKIRVNAGETYYMALAINSAGTGYGTGKLSCTLCDNTNNYDYSVAAAYTMGSKITVEPGDAFMKWYTFTPSVSGTYWLENGLGESTVWSNVAVGTITDGAWTNVQNINASSGMVSANTVELVAGTTYYICVRANGNGNAVFKLSDDVPSGTAKSTAYDITVGGASVPAEYEGLGLAWYKVVIASDGDYVFERTMVTGTSSTLTLYDSADQKVTLSSGAGSNQQMAKGLEAGTYYISASISSTAIPSVAVYAIPNGYNAEHAISFAFPESADTVSFANPLSAGTWYKFTASESKFVKISSETFTGSIKIYSSQSTSLASFKDGEVHAKVTSGTDYYVVVSGYEGSADFTCEYVDSIQDGLSDDTAYIVAVDEVKTITYVSGSSSVYINVTPTETADYIIRKVSNTYTSYVYDLTAEGAAVTLTSGQNGNEKIASLVAGHTYKFYYTYYSTHTFCVTKVGSGYSFDAAIDLTLGATFDAENFNNGGMTYYTFEATESKFYQFTTESGAGAKLFNSSKSEIASLVSGEMHAKLTAGSTYYFAVGGDAGVYSFSLALLDTVQDGLTADTAFVYTPDEGQEYMTIPSINGGSSVYLFYRISGLTAGKDYVFSTNAGKDIDISGVYNSDGTTTVSGSFIKIDAGTSYSTYRCGTSSDAYATFTAPSDGEVVIKVRWYASGTYSAKLNLWCTNPDPVEPESALPESWDETETNFVCSDLATCTLTMDYVNGTATVTIVDSEYGINYTITGTYTSVSGRYYTFTAAAGATFTLDLEASFIEFEASNFNVQEATWYDVQEIRFAR